MSQELHHRAIETRRYRHWVRKPKAAVIGGLGSIWMTALSRFFCEPRSGIGQVLVLILFLVCYLRGGAGEIGWCLRTTVTGSPPR